MSTRPKLKNELRKAKILAIDDDEWFLRLLVKKFEDVDPGFKITPAKSAEEAIDLLVKESFDCILCDHKLPGTIMIKGKKFPSDGIHLMRKFTDELEIDTPVIFVTGQGSEEIASQALLEGASGYFIKRVQPGYYSLMATSIRQTIDRYWLQKELQESESRYRDLFENSVGLIFITDQDGNFQESNKGFIKLYGYTRNEIKGISYKKIAFKEDLKKWSEMINSIKEGNIESRMLRSITKNEQIIHIDITARPIYGNTTETVTGIQAIARDITNQIKTQQALIDSEERHRKVVEGTGEGFIIMEKEGIILDWNRAAIGITGIISKDAIGKPIWEIIQKLNPSNINDQKLGFRAQEEFQKIIPKDNVSSLDNSIEYSIKNVKDGSTRIVESNSFTIDHSKGYRIALVLKDITKKHLAESQTKSITKHFQTLIEETPIGVWVADVNQKTTYVNNGVANLLGYSPHELIGVSVLDFVTPQGAAKLQEITRKRQANEPTDDTYEIDFYHRSGKKISTLITGAAIRNDDGQLQQTFGFIRDISIVKEREKELQTTKEFLESIIESIQSGIYTYNLKYKITMANPRLAEILGYTSHHQLIDKNLFDFFPRNEHEMVKNLIQETMTGKKSDRHLQLTYITRSGEEKKASVSTVPLIVDDRVEGALVTVTDITEKKRLEKYLNRVQNEFQRLVENIPNGLMKVDNLGQVIYYNEKAQDIFRPIGIDNLKSLNILHNPIFIDSGLSMKFRDIIYQKYLDNDVIIEGLLLNTENKEYHLRFLPFPLYANDEPRISSWFILVELILNSSIKGDS